MGGVARQPSGRTLRRYRILSLGVAATDALAIVVAMQVAFLALRGDLRPVTTGQALVPLITVLVWIGVFQGFRLYVLHQLASAEEFRRLFGAATLGIALVILASFWMGQPLSREWVGLTWGTVLVLELGSRWLWRRFVHWLKIRRSLAFRTLIVGTGGEGAELAEQLAEPDLGFTPIGFVSMNGPSRSPNGLPIVGTLRRLPETIRETGADCVFVASPIGVHRMRGVARVGRREGVEVRAAAALLPQILSTRLAVHPLGDVMSLCLSPVRLTHWQALIKRSFDLLVTSFAVLLTLPVWIAVAAAIKLDSRGPIFFRQERAGRMGRRFTMLKFRTMVQDAEARKAELAAQNEADGPLFKVRDDPRITRVGKILRRWSLDELPQLLNVLRGDMTLVGPRPSLPDEVAEYEEWHFDRLEVAPGVTGLWQVSGRSDLTFEDYVKRDIFYIENWSLSIDLYILLKTIPAVLSRSGAF